MWWRKGSEKQPAGAGCFACGALLLDGLFLRCSLNFSRKWMCTPNSYCAEEVLPANVRHNMYFQLLWFWEKAGAVANDWFITERDCSAGRSHLLGAFSSQVLPFPLCHLYYYLTKAGEVLYSTLCTLGLSCAETLRYKILLLREAVYTLIFEVPCLLEGVCLS